MECEKKHDKVSRSEHIAVCTVWMDFLLFVERTHVQSLKVTK